jgi:cell division protein FtsW
MNRADRNFFSDWLWTVDRPTALTALVLIGIGLLLSVAASPAASGGPATEGNFHFALKQMIFASVAIAILFGASLLKPRDVLKAAVVIFALSVVGSFAVLVIGHQTLGARRWLDLGFFTLQPSEFLKPSFAVLAAAILANPRKTAWPKPAIALVLLAPALLVLMLQPDVGQTFLLLLLLVSMLFFAGLALKWIWMVGGGMALLAGIAIWQFQHVQHRVIQFLHPTEKGLQVGLSLKAFNHGGLFGVGAGAGTVKYHLPDVHSDFIFAVAGEEYGLAMCAVILLLFLFLSLRLMWRAAQARDGFTQLAIAGLATVLSLQAFINMAVALNMMPAKGMTLPFISAGGSSLFAVALSLGFVLALGRQRLEAELGEVSSLTTYGGTRS